jgi:hypothetical protein
VVNAEDMVLWCSWAKSNRWPPRCENDAERIFKNLAQQNQAFLNGKEWVAILIGPSMAPDWPHAWVPTITMRMTGNGNTDPIATAHRVHRQSVIRAQKDLGLDVGNSFGEDLRL